MGAAIKGVLDLPRFSSRCFYLRTYLISGNIFPLPITVINANVQGNLRIVFDIAVKIFWVTEGSKKILSFI